MKGSRGLEKQLLSVNVVFLENEALRAENFGFDILEPMFHTDVQVLFLWPRVTMDFSELFQLPSCLKLCTFLLSGIE